MAVKGVTARQSIRSFVTINLKNTESPICLFRTVPAHGSRSPALWQTLPFGMTLAMQTAARCTG